MKAVTIAAGALVLISVAPAFAKSNSKKPSRSKQTVVRATPAPQYPVGGARIYNAGCLYIGSWLEGHPGTANCF